MCVQGFWRLGQCCVRVYACRVLRPHIVCCIKQFLATGAMLCAYMRMLRFHLSSFGDPTLKCTRMCVCVCVCCACAFPGGRPPALVGAQHPPKACLRAGLAAHPAA